MSQFKPGDLALVVGGDRFLGQQVEILQWMSPGDVWMNSAGHEYQLRQDSPAAGWMVTNGELAAIKREVHLMPLRGDFAPTEQKRQEVPA